MKLLKHVLSCVAWVSLFIFLTVFIAANAYGVWVEPYLKKVDTRDVRSITVLRYRFIGGDWELVERLSAEYSAAGDLIRETRHTADGLLQYEYLYRYNDRGHMIEVTGQRRRSEQIVPYAYTYRYDERGNQVEGIGYGADGSETSRYTARYDEHDNFVEGVEYTKGDIVSKYIAEYDERNNLINESKYTVYRYKGSEGYQLEYRQVFSYDGRDNLITEKKYGGEERLEYHYVYQYDDQDNLTSGTSLSADGAALSRYTAEYDENNNLITSVHSGPKGGITSKHRARYDSRNNMIEEIDCTGDPEKVIFRSEYNEAGDVLEETHYGDNVIGGAGLDYRYRYAYDSRNNRVEETYFVYFKEEEVWKPISRQVNQISYQE
jgi:hypothetical protein